MLAGSIIYSILSADPVVGPLVSDGNAATFRIFPLRIPISADQLPLIAYEGDDDEQTPTMGGMSSLIEQKVRIACMSNDYDDSKIMGVAVYNAMRIASGVKGGIVVSRVFYRTQSEEEQTLPGLGEDINTYFNIMEFDIWYAQPLPAQVTSPFSFGLSAGFQ